MAQNGNGHRSDAASTSKATWTVKSGLAQMLRGGVIRRINEGAAMIRSKGEAGTGNIVEAVRHIREITGGIEALADLDESQLREKAAEYRVPLELVRDVAKAKKLPVVLFCAGGIATPADAALMMQLGAEGNFVGSGIFKASEDPKA